MSTTPGNAAPPNAAAHANTSAVLPHCTISAWSP
jgi:hypothetical protein